MISVDFSAAIIVALVFVLVLVLERLFFEPLARTIEERRDRVVSAERLRAEGARAVEELLARYREVIGSARAEGYSELDRAREEALEEKSRRLELERERAIAEIARARESLRRQAEEAVRSFKAEVDRLAAEIASVLLGRKVA